MIFQRSEPDPIHVENASEKVDTLGVDLDDRGAFKGDNSDGRVDWSVRQLIAVIALTALYVGSQIPLYFVSASLSFIAADLHDTTKNSWLPISHTLAVASIAPFCGYLQDLLGRRIISLCGSLAIMGGIVITATAHTLGQAVTGMALSGCGAAAGELTALAGVAELVPVNKRGLYLALVTISILPFTPVLLFAELLSTYSTWRWGLWISLIWNGTAFLVTLVTYFPQAHTRAAGLSKRDVLRRIDYLGAFLIIVGLTLFLVGLQSGGYNHSWRSGYVLSMLLIGAALVIAFPLWEWKGAKHPMVPPELFAGQRVIALAFFIAFVAGINYYSFLNFLPLTYTDVYNPDPVQVGLKGLGPSISTALGAAVVNALLSVLKGYNRELLLFSIILMTAFTGSLAAINPSNPDLIVALSCIAGFGIGGVLVPAATIAITACHDDLIATAVAISLSVRTVGGSIGYAIYYNVFINKITTELPHNIGLSAVKAGLPLRSLKAFVEAYIEDPTKLALVHGVTPKVLAAAAKGSQLAYSESLKYVFYTSIAFGSAGIIACFFLPNMSKYMTNRIAVRISH